MSCAWKTLFVQRAGGEGVLARALGAQGEEGPARVGSPEDQTLGARGFKETTNLGSYCLGRAVYEGFPGGSVGKEFTFNAGNMGWKIPWRREQLPLQYSDLENSMDRGAWQATVHGVEKSQDTTEQLSLATFYRRSTLLSNTKGLQSVQIMLHSMNTGEC